MTYLYDFSGGMESAAMVSVCRDEIRERGGIVRWADTGKQFPEMADSIAQIERLTGLSIVRLEPNMTFDEFLFERGGMLRQGYTDCSRRMKRKALRDHAAAQPLPQRIALGYNSGELERAEAFCLRNNKADREFIFPLIDRDISRADTVKICEAAGFSILLEMYRKIGRFDCFFCPNQRISQAEKVMKHYPSLWSEWKDIERRKGHSILAVSAEQIEMRGLQEDFFLALDRKSQCSCFGGDADYDEAA